jgi:hypothetical protein
MHANASWRSALSYGHAKKIEKQLKWEIKWRAEFQPTRPRADSQQPRGASTPRSKVRIVCTQQHLFARRRDCIPVHMQCELETIDGCSLSIHPPQAQLELTRVFHTRDPDSLGFTHGSSSEYTCQRVRNSARFSRAHSNALLVSRSSPRQLGSEPIPERRTIVI